MYLDSRQVTQFEFTNKFGDEYKLKGSLSYFMFGEDGGAYKDNVTGEVVFVNLPKGLYSEIEEYKLLMEICGSGRDIGVDREKIPALKTAVDYEEEYKQVSLKSKLIWGLWILLSVVLPIGLALLMFTVLTS